MSQSTSQRILFLDSSPFVGGAQESFFSLLCSLPSLDFEPFLLSASIGTDSLIERAEHYGIACQSFACRHWSLSPLGFLQYLQDTFRFRKLYRQVIRDFQPDLIHVNCLRSLLLLPHFNTDKIPVVFHDRDLSYSSFLRRLISKRFNLLLAVSQTVAQQWQGVVAKEKVKVVYNGIDLKDFSTENEDDSADKAAFKLLQVADFVKWKNHELFLQVITLLKDQIPGLKAKIRGRARNTAEEKLRDAIYQRRKELELEDILEIADYSGSAKKELAETDILLSCSENEPFGRVIIEALAAGKTVIAVNSAGPAEILKNQKAGSLCEANPEEIAKRVINWHKNDNYLKNKNEAKKLAEKFSLEKHIQKIIEIYQSL